jgi:hypothetical protein
VKHAFFWFSVNVVVLMCFYVKHVFFWFSVNVVVFMCFLCETCVLLVFGECPCFNVKG